MLDNLVNNLSQKLKHPDEEVRLSALAALRESTDSAVLSILDQALGNESWRVRKATVELIKDFGDREEVIRLLIRALGDEDNAGRRTAAVEALVALGRECVPYLLKEIRHPDQDVRKFIVDILGEIKDPAAVDVIIAMTRDPQENIRLASVETLGAIGGDRSFEALLALLSSDDVSLQFSVLYALSRLGRPIPLESIKPLMEKRILRRALYDALGQTRSAEAVELIAEGLHDPAKSTRQAAVRALYQLSEVPGLERLVEQTVQRRFQNTPLEPFMEFLESNQLLTKRATIRLLALVGTPEAIRLLVRAAHDDSIQADIAEAIASFKSQGAQAMVEEIEKEKKPSMLQDLIPLLRPAPPAFKLIGPMSHDQFLKVRDLVAVESGMFYEPDLKYLVERRVQRRMETLNLADYDEYLRRLGTADASGRDELRKLINALSTNETYFFREDFQLKAFQEEILPALVKAKESTGQCRLRIWSAGCSSGEEPYTIAILIKESLIRENGFQVEIIGSDINDEVLEQARHGLYNQSSFRVTPERYLKKYFVAEGSRYQLVDSIRQMVNFDTQNLLTCREAPHLKNLDVIFCRNVIIYFGPEAKRKVVENFYHLLNPGGYLLLGHSESLMSVSTRFQLLHLEHDMVYQKPPAKEGRR